MMRKHIPLLLTCFRLFISPLLLPLVIVRLLPLNIVWINSAVGIFFMALSMTDFLDGYFARRFNAVSAVGRILDPIADKVLVISALVSLVAVGKLFFMWAVLFIMRDFFVMGIRLLAAEYGMELPVSLSAKCKTAAQMLFVASVIVNPSVHSIANIGFSSTMDVMQSLLLGIALCLTLFSAYGYYRSFYTRLKYMRAFNQVIDEHEHD